MNKKLKATCIVILIILITLSLIINGWYFYIREFGAEKVVSHTFEVGLQTTTDGNTKYFMEVNSFDNCFEVKFNYMLDEDMEAFYSQGLQYYNSSANVEFKEYTKVETVKRQENVFGWDSTYYAYKDVLIDNTAGTHRINYMSGDDYERTLISTNPIGDNTYFKISLNNDGVDEVYLMKFKGNIRTSDENIRMDKGWWYTDFVTYYDVYDVDRLAGLIYFGIDSMPYGTECATIFEFGDLFEYYVPEDGKESSYLSISQEKADLITEDIKSYYSIKVTKHEGQIQKASQSLFNCVDGNSNFNISGNVGDSYFVGRTVVDCDIYDFDKVVIADNHVALKLSSVFINEYLRDKQMIYLDIIIDLDELKSQGLTFVGFSKDSYLSEFTINQCLTKETVAGQTVYTEVNYDI